MLLLPAPQKTGADDERNHELVGLDVTLRGEAAEGKEGPYRQFFSDVFRELCEGEALRDDMVVEAGSLGALCR